MSRKLIVFTAYTTVGMLGVYMTLFQYTILDMTRFFLPGIAMMGGLIGVQSLGMGISPLVFGGLSVRLGKRKVILIAYLLLIAGTLAIGLTPWLALFVVAAFVTGAGFSVLEATLCAVLADEFPEKSIRHLNFSQVFFSIGAMIGPVIVRGLIDAGFFFKGLFYFCSLIFALLCITFFFTKQSNDSVNAESGDAVSCFVGLMKSRIFLLLAAFMMIYVGVEACIANFSGSYFELVLDNPELSAAALSLFWGAMIPARVIAGMQKIDTKTIMVYSMIIVLAGVFGAMLLPWRPVKLVMFALCGFGCGPLWPMTMNESAKKSLGSSGLIMNSLVVFGSIGGAVFPFFSGILASAASQTQVYYLCGIATVALLVLYLRSVKGE